MANLFSYEDEYGIKNYRNFPILAIIFSVFVLVVYTMGNILYHVEINAPGHNITKLNDAIWLVYMAASTIGFGDFYPVTFIGRIIVGSMFLIGALFLGSILGLAANITMGFMDTSVKNRELRAEVRELREHNEQVELATSHLMKQLTESHKMNEDMFDHNKHIEAKLDVLMNHMDEVTPELKMEKV